MINWKIFLLIYFGLVWGDRDQTSYEYCDVCSQIIKQMINFDSGHLQKIMDYWGDQWWDVTGGREAESIVLVQGWHSN
jgi:hypothetical protein